ncbi:methyltransferase [Alkalibaculum sp. M08DMB]|uniref:Methyltransferase n=1 Tax=Alkalibaculum sporogenes TaxID=2655001 RepID=A0A6A7K8K7_9FIRM|nr:MgtC/SapB family protein [Alkalibaculum sporogenes]MPW25839.1 methyltransferase [Alkalibaculum sporogenes]
MNLTTTDIVIRLVLSIILSGIIGFEREHTKKPAGFRTHILLSIGATTVMIASIMMFEEYRSYTNMDPARLGAQVISGIGFLGAGTIIREGVSVKGLTTAAGTWAVGCIGLTVGSGYYELSIISTIVVFATLKIFGNIQYKYGNANEKYTFILKYNEVFKIDVLFKYIDVESTHLLSFDDTDGKAKFVLQIKKNEDYTHVLKQLSEDENITFISTYIEQS